MKKFWKYFKNIVLVCGFISLAFVLFAAISLTISGLIQHKAAKQEQNEGFAKTFNDIKLKVTRKYDKTSSFFVSVSRTNKPLITNYLLPTKQYDLDWIKITDASVIPVKDNLYRIILYSAVYDCDEESGHYVWILKLDNQMHFIKMIDLSDIHKIEGNETLLFGNKIISLPSFTDFKYEQIVFPIEVRISDTIRTTPMLNQQSIEMMKRHYNKEIDERMAKLSKSSDAAMLEQYKKASEEFKEVLSEKIIPY
jgi:hypothetical protein